MYRITGSRLQMQEQGMSSPNEREGSEIYFHTLHNISQEFTERLTSAISIFMKESKSK